MRTDTTHDAGFTLIELLLALTVMAMIAGAAYSSFNYALNVYQRDAIQLSLEREVRVALEAITQDLTSALVDPDDEDLQFYVEDVPGQVETEALDLLSFVTTVPTTAENELAEPLSPDPPSQRTTTTTQEETEEEPTVPSDLLRVLYMIGPDPRLLTTGTTATDSTATTDSTTESDFLRVRTTTLNLEDAFGEALGQDPTQMVSLLLDGGAEIDVLAKNVRSFNLVYFDGEEWLDTWDVEEQGVPRAVRVALTTEDSRRRTVTYTRSSTALLVTHPGEGGGSQSGQTPQGGTGPQSGPPGGQGGPGGPGGPPPGGG